MGAQTTPSAGWMVGRAVMAIALMAGFYLFALAIVAALFWIPYAEWVFIGRLHLKIAAVCIGAGCAILWAVMPRPDRFEPPGPELTDTAHPRLFDLIREVASSTEQTEPREVYLLSDVNAFVTQRGGVMGIGSRRVMGIGLPLLQSLSVTELRAVLAHEFGHYWGGDVAIGPWIYKTRAAIGRAIGQLEGSALQGLFNGYGRLFMKLTTAISRRQEYVADELAARVAGAAVMQRALTQVTALTHAHMIYVNNEVLPVLRSGFLPPVAQGFDLFRAEADMRQATDKIVDQTLTSGTTGEFDTHPTLRERLAALDRLAHEASPPDESVPAVSLVDDPDTLGRALLEHAIGVENVAALKSVTWDVVGPAVYEPQWQAMVEHHRTWLTPLRVDGLPSGPSSFITLGSELVGRQEININSEERIRRAVQVIAMALGCLLVRHGWALQSDIGKPIVLVRGQERFDPFATVKGLADGSVTREAWEQMCSRLVVSGDSLGPPARA